MKKVVIFLLLAALLLTGCAGKKYTVNAEDGTISDGKYTYQYKDESTAQSRTIRIVYPNGGIYRWEQDIGEHQSYSGGRGNELYDPVEYARGEDLVDAILEPKQPPEDPYAFSVNWPFVLMGIAMIGLGIWQAASPHLQWHWRFGRWYKNSEPSDEGIGWIMASGYIDMIIGIIMILLGIFL